MTTAKINHSIRGKLADVEDQLERARAETCIAINQRNRWRDAAFDGTLVKEKTMMEKEIENLDEIRRLLYMALAVHQTKRYELVGTLVNALMQHTAFADDPRDTMEWLVRVVEGKTSSADLRNVYSIITRITEKLETREAV